MKAPRRRQFQPLTQPRNMIAVEMARAKGQSLIVSFVGDTAWPNPTVYCDGGKRYDWGFITGLHTIVVARPGVDLCNALSEILARTDTLLDGYPVLVDAELQEAACVVGPPLGLWQIRPATEQWQKYFSAP